MEYNDTNIEVKKIKDYNYSDETKLIFTDVDTGDTIGYIIFTEECFSDNYDERFDGQYKIRKKLNIDAEEKTQDYLKGLL